jgi:hypothetical protein
MGGNKINKKPLAPTGPRKKTARNKAAQNAIGTRKRKIATAKRILREEGYLVISPKAAANLLKNRKRNTAVESPEIPKPARYEIADKEEALEVATRIMRIHAETFRKLAD